MRFFSPVAAGVLATGIALGGCLIDEERWYPYCVMMHFENQTDHDVSFNLRLVPHPAAPNETMFNATTGEHFGLASPGTEGKLSSFYYGIGTYVRNHTLQVVYGSGAWQMPIEASAHPVVVRLTFLGGDVAIGHEAREWERNPCNTPGARSPSPASPSWIQT